MQRKAIVQIIVGVALIASLVFIARNLGAVFPISDEQIDVQITNVSVLMTAQYPKIIAHFPEETATIREEAKRHERMRRRGNIVTAGNLVAFTRQVMAPKFRAIQHAPEELLDASLERVLNSYSVLQGTPACGRFLLNGTIVIPISQRQQLWERQADDTEQHFEAILAGLSDPQQHPPATVDTWEELYARYRAEGNPQSHIDTYLLAFGKNPAPERANKDVLCTAFLGLGRTLIGARFPGSATIKAGLIIRSFGVSP